ncbi:MAG: TetR/AcrR family transcriptional regulator [Sphingomonadales bacterium]|nr:TetR/AcrR family transcriptional regulator [Sphingomonadales bacterium]
MGLDNAESAPRKPETAARKRDSVATRNRILEAAFECFAEQGYSRAGIREIAEKAGIASSLVIRYFGSKVALFERALVHALYTRALFIADKADFGRQMAMLLVEESDTRLTAMTVLALGDPEAEAVVRRVVAQHTVGPLIEWLGEPEAIARATSVYALMTGFTMMLRLSENRRLPAGTVDWLARAFQDLVDGPAAA